MNVRNSINSKKVAELAHVSRSTVSRVINNYPNVPEKTRDKVMAVIEKMGYFPNSSARMLAGKQSDSIGLFWILHEPISEDFSSNLFIVSIIEQATLMGYSVLTNVITNLTDPENVRKVRAAFCQQKFEGAIFIGCNANEPLLDSLVAENYHIAILEQEFAGHDEPNRIIVNFDEQASEQAVDYLVSLGHKKIGLLYGTLERYGGIQKHRGYLKGFLKNEIPLTEKWTRCCDFSEMSAYKQMKDILLHEKELPTAFCCANDFIAFGAIKAIQEFSLSVPNDVSVIGLDDHVGSSMFSPPLTTFRYDLKNLMRTLTRELILSLPNSDDSKVRHFEFHAKLVKRESCKSI